MDLHALSQGRARLVTRGLVGVLVGVVLTNNSSMSAATLATLVGTWTLVDGACTLWQANQTDRPGRPADLHPALLVVGTVGVLVGAVTVLDIGPSTTGLTWLLAAWFGFRALAELGGAAGTAGGRSRLLLTLAAVADLGVVAVFVTHSSGGASLGLFGGAVAVAWGLLLMFLGGAAGKTPRREVLAPGMLSPR